MRRFGGCKPLYIATLLYSAQAAQIGQIKAIEPTSAGQIGVNIVDLPPASVFVGSIGVNTQYLTGDGLKDLKWIGPDPSYITKTALVTVTATGSPPATITSDVSISVQELASGDLEVLTGPALRQGLQDIASKVTPCGAKLRPRLDFCGFNNFMDEATRFGPIQGADAAIGPGRLLIPAADIAALVANFQAAAAGATVVVLPAATVGLLYLIWEQIQSGNQVAPVIKVPESIKGTPTPTLTPTSQTSSTSTSQCAQPTTATPAICKHEKCLGEAQELCTVGDDKGCRCLQTAVEYGEPRPVLVWQIHREQQFVMPETALLAVFCKDNDLKTDKTSTLKAADAGLSAYDGLTFSFDWASNSPACTQPCTDIFAAFTQAMGCASTSHSMSKRGTISENCGDAAFKIFSPSPPAEPSPTTLAPPPTQPPSPALGVPQCSPLDGFKQSDASAKAKVFCDAAITRGLRWKQDDGEPSPVNELNGFWGYKFFDVRVSSGNMDNVLYLSVELDQKGCPAGANFEVDFKTLGTKKCRDNFMIGVDGCGPFLKFGGWSYNDCVKWTVSSAVGFPIAGLNIRGLDVK
ncbi:uncharacterized protein BP5553_02989 [Venustampulla echinocandica]|uniref:Uncharacterized protein n=1 Tax=Venustampulla echinocandica TaxID=2656787 RepID=A0A370TSZ1_9HELO|nr:uncharacterized protein BP5553_02989 [Venustampulla echinocandica]RDL38649.1 hypothetical protein BP5553_02989 [Venustampulla echinocandica]